MHFIDRGEWVHSDPRGTNPLVVTSLPSSCLEICWFSLLQVFWALGTVFEVLLAVVVMPTLGWRWLLILSALPLLLFAVLCFVGIPQGFM